MFSEAAGYEWFMGRWSRQLAPHLVRFAGVRDGDRLLDVGSGTGALSFAAATVADTRITGLDPSAAYVDYATQQASTDRVCFEVGDAMDLPFEDGMFDKTLSMLVLNFVSDPAAALREMARVTRPSGVVAAAVWDYGDGMKMLRTFWDEVVRLAPAAASRDERHMPLCTRGALSELWREYGLQSVEEDELAIAMHFTSFDDYWQPFTAGQGPAGHYVASLDESVLRTLKSRLRLRLTDDAFSLCARAWAVRGTVILTPWRTAGSPGVRR
jgi:SAM-dependent methyltransferase